MRSQPNPRASLSTIRTVQPAIDNSTEEQKDALDMFDVFGVSRPEGWLSEEREQQQVSRMKTVQVCHSCGGFLHTRSRCARCGHEFCFKCKTELVSVLAANIPADGIHTQEQQKSELGGWRQGVTHSQSLGTLSEAGRQDRSRRHAGSNHKNKLIL